MRKTYSIICSAIILLAMLTGILVGCDKNNKNIYGKNVLPTGGKIGADVAIGEIMSAWISNNGYDGEGVFGWEMGFDYTEGDSSSISIEFNGGLAADNSDVLEFSIVDNKKADAEKNIFSIIANKEASYITIFDKTYKAPELKVESDKLTPSTEEEFTSQINSMVKILTVFARLADAGSSVEYVKEKENYTKKYNIKLDVSNIFEDVSKSSLFGCNIIPSTIVEEIKKIFGGNTIEINAIVQDVKLVTIIKEEGNDIFYTYDFRGGNVSPDGISILANDEDGKVHAVNINGLIILNTMPVLTIPENSIEIRVLEHQIDGYFAMHDKSGKTIATYNYSIDMKLSADDLLENLYLFLTGDIVPVISAIFESKDGKMLIDISHTCGDGCVEHMSGKVENKSLITIAFDPSDKAFNNNNIYIAANIKSLIPANLFDALGLTANEVKDLKAAIPNDFISIVLDPLIEKEIEDIENATELSNEKTSSEIDANGDKIPEIDGGIDIVSAIIEFIKSFSLDNDVMTIDYDHIINEIVLKLNLDKQTQEKVMSVLNSLFPNVDKMTTKADYINTPAEDTLNAYLEFIKDKTFSANNDVYSPILGEIKAVGGIKSPRVMLKDNLGKELPVSYDEIMGLCFDPSKEENATIEVSFTGLDGKDYKKDMYIKQVIGLNATDKGVVKVRFVLTGGLGSNINEVLKSMSNVIDLPFYEKIMSNMLSEAIVEINIKITQAVEIKWSQEGIGNKENHVDIQKHYIFDDSIETGYNIVVTYESGEVKQSPTVLYPINMNEYIAEGKIKYCDNFTLVYDGFGVYRKKINIIMDASQYADTQSMVVNESEVYKISNMLNNTTGMISVIDEKHTVLAVKNFCANINNNATYKVICSKENDVEIIELVIDKAGEYTLPFVGKQGDKISLKITVMAADVSVE